MRISNLIAKNVFILRVITSVVLGVCVFYWINLLPFTLELRVSWFAVLGYWFPTLWRILRK